MSDETVSADAKQSKPWQFKPGQSGNPAGRKKGSRNKLGEDFISALQEDFEQHGKTAIAVVRVERPDAYLKVIASILPKQIEVNTNALNEMSDDELASALETVRQLVLAGALAATGAGEQSSDSREPAPQLPPVH